MFGKLVVFLAKSDCMHVIRKLASDPDVESGLYGKDELKAFEAVHRIVEQCHLVTATHLILNESNVKGELVAEPKKRKYESSAELWAEGRTLLATDEDEDEDVLATDEQKSIEQEQQYKYKPSSPAYSPTESVYKRRPNNKSIILALPAERAQPPAFWADDADDL